MLVFVDEREIVATGYTNSFNREGVSLTSFDPSEFHDWVNSAGEHDLAAVEAFLIGDCPDRHQFSKIIRQRSRAPLIAMNDGPSLERTLELFACGVDDVVRKPVHAREILARVDAIRRRVQVNDDYAVVGDMRVFFDGRDPEILGEPLPLPRRERRMLEYLVQHRGKRVTKSQIFNAVYGIFDEDVEEAVVESHMSKLRKKLRARLDFDPIDSKRYLGYCLSY
jgi:DNA-binding response OmpR family regulator